MYMKLSGLNVAFIGFNLCLLHPKSFSYGGVKFG